MYLYRKLQGGWKKQTKINRIFKKILFLKYLTHFFKD